MKPQEALPGLRPQYEANEELFQFLFHDHPLPMWVCDLETLAFLEVNHAAVEKYGYAREEFLTMTLKDISPSKDVTGMLGDVLDPSLGRKHSQWGRHKLRNGHIIDVEVSSYTMAYPKSNDHKVAYVIVQDTNKQNNTKQNKTEHQTPRSAIGHRVLLETIQEGFAYCRMIFENHRPVDFGYLKEKQVIANKELRFQNEEKEKRAAELVIANKELLFQNAEKEKRAAELVIANKELLFQNAEKEKRAAELVNANKELLFQNAEKEKRAAELVIANKELFFQNEEKEKRAAEVVIAHKELLLQNEEKEKRAAELVIANKELLFQNEEKEKRAAELVIANKELLFQNNEKGKRAAELVIANKELLFQNNEKEKRAAELVIANKEVFSQNEERRRTAELVIADKELLLQDEERRRTTEAIRDSEERFRMVFEHVFDGISIYREDPDPSKRTLVECNDRYAAMAGRRRAELLQRGSTQGLQITLEDTANSVRLKSLIGEMSYQGTFSWIRPDGKENIIEYVGMPITWRGKSYSIGIDRDITERTLAEQALREREQKYRNIFENVQDVYYEASIDGTILEVSPSIETMSKGQYQRNDLIGKSLNDFYSGVRERQALLSVLKERGSVADAEVTLKNRDGSFIPCSISAKIQFDAQGSPKTIIGSMRDITERKKAEEIQLESTRRFRQLFDEAPVGYYELDDQGRIIQVNLTELEMLGFRRDEMLKHYPWEFFVESETSRNAVRALLDGSVSEGDTTERTFRRKDGTLLSVLITNRTLRSEDGKIVGVRSALQNITNRKCAEQALQSSEERLKLALAATLIGVWEWNVRTNEVFWSDECYEIVGMGRATENTLEGFLKLVHPDDLDRFSVAVQRSLAGKEQFAVEYRTVRPNGEVLWMHDLGRAEYDATGNPTRMIGTVQDITARKKAEEHIRESEEQFRLIAENVADMIAVLDLDGRRIYNSPSYRSILGDPGSLKGTDGYREIHPDDRERVRHVFEETVKTGVGQRMEYRLMGKDGSERTIDSKGSVIRDGDGKIFRIVVVSRDVTEEKSLAAQFLRAQRMESIGTLAGGIAHDLNNVLAPIMMAIEILKRKVSDEGGQRILTTIETSAKRGADIVRQVLAFGRGLKGDRILVQLEHVINEVIKIVGETFPKAIEIKTNIPRDLSTVEADPTQMHQVLLNLLVNARDAMPGGGTLTILAENVKLDENYSRMNLEAKPGPYTCIVITDTGTGIPADVREKIFEPFFTTKEIGKGTGLGLSTTLAIVKSHGGFITLYSEMGKGTTFRIYIPATGTTSGEEAAIEEVVLPEGNDELILLIDDEASIREITKETLEAHGYKVMTACDGAEGVAIFAENKENVKVVITDIMMPVMDGTAAILVLKRIKPDVRIIAASGLTTRRQLTTPSDSNVLAFLPKPYTAEKMLKTLAQVRNEKISCSL